MSGHTSVWLAERFTNLLSNCILSYFLYKHNELIFAYETIAKPKHSNLTMISIPVYNLI